MNRANLYAIRARQLHFDDLFLLLVYDITIS